MDKLNLILMGKTGAGKSTLVNTVMGENVAPVKVATRESKVYSREMMIPMVRDMETGLFSMVARSVCLHDTVGLEIDQAITERTLEDIRGLIQQAQNQEKERDITLVWFCVNHWSSRFEPYEVELIRKLSIEYEIPFVMVVTQCMSEEKGELEEQIETDVPELPIIRILAQAYKTRGGTLPAFGVEELLSRSVLDYDKNKVRVLEAKLDRLIQMHQNKIENLQESGEICIHTYKRRAKKIGRIPVGCIPFVHRQCIKMISELNKIAGIKSSKEIAEDIYTRTIVSVVATPLMAVPVLSVAVAETYIKTVGNNYLNALLRVVQDSSATEMGNNALMIQRLQKEIKKRTGGNFDG